MTLSLVNWGECTWSDFPAWNAYAFGDWECGGSFWVIGVNEKQSGEEPGAAEDARLKGLSRGSLWSSSRLGRAVPVMFPSLHGLLKPRARFPLWAPLYRRRKLKVSWLQPYIFPWLVHRDRVYKSRVVAPGMETENWLGIGSLRSHLFLPPRITSWVRSQAFFYVTVVISVFHYPHRLHGCHTSVGTKTLWR